MTRGIPRELKKEIYEVLKDLANRQPGTEPPLRSIFIEHRRTQTNSEYLAVHAVFHLTDIGVLDPNLNGLRITAFGWDYWEKLNTPRIVHWLRQNAFAATVAVATIATSVGGIIFNALD